MTVEVVEFHLNDRVRFDLLMLSQGVYLRVVTPDSSFNFGLFNQYYFDYSEALTGHIYFDAYIQVESNYLYDKEEAVVSWQCSRSEAKALLSSLNDFRDSNTDK